MKAIPSLATLFALSSLFALQPAFAASPKPSEESVRQLLEAMHTGEAIKGSFAHMDDMLRTSMKDVDGRPLNAEQQKIRDETRAKVVALMKQQLDWSTTLEPIMVESYRDTFTQRGSGCAAQVLPHADRQVRGREAPGRQSADDAAHAAAHPRDNAEDPGDRARLRGAHQGRRRLGRRAGRAAAGRAAAVPAAAVPLAAARRATATERLAHSTSCRASSSTSVGVSK